MRMRSLAVGAAVVIAATVLSGCERGSTLIRFDAPQVLTGAALPTLLGQPLSSVVAFAHVRRDGTPTWRQIPVQIDERRMVFFGSAPGNNADAGVPGTVYGSGEGGPSALQYTDPDTWVGADTDERFDADDELVFMTGDAGGEREPGGSDPAGVVAGSGVRVELTDPLDAGASGSVYLFRSNGSLVPSAGKDYVNYQFNLTSGNYRTTYLRADGPNPETSRVTTASYEIGYTDRWIESSWTLDDSSSSGVDILDGLKNQFAVNSCVRSNRTFADAEGAFVANVDGPVRAIRSYVGANSGPLTQRTHLMYRNREVVVTDLRVHSIPGVMDFLDFSAAARGMTYQSETVPNGVLVDGGLDTVPTTPARWEAVSGDQGTVLINVDHQTSFNPPGGFPARIQWFQRDQTSPPEAQCWGDGSFLGAAGPTITGGIPNTDPRTGPFETLKGIRTIHFAGAIDDPDVVGDLAADWSTEVRTPLTVTVSAG
jgi:hypothetical protein